MGHRGGQPQRLQEGPDGLRVFHHRYQAQAPVALRAGEHVDPERPLLRADARVRLAPYLCCRPGGAHSLHMDLNDPAVPGRIMPALERIGTALLRLRTTRRVSLRI